MKLKLYLRDLRPYSETIRTIEYKELGFPLAVVNKGKTYVLRSSGFEDGVMYGLYYSMETLVLDEEK